MQGEIKLGDIRLIGVPKHLISQLPNMNFDCVYFCFRHAHVTSCDFPSALYNPQSMIAK